MTRGRRKKKRRRQRTLLFVIQFVSTSVLPLLLHFGRRRFFGDPFLCVFPLRRLVNVANFRRGDERASTLFSFSFPSFDPFVANFRESSEGWWQSFLRSPLAKGRFKCQIFWKCKQVESPSVSRIGRGSVIFSPFFRESKVSAVLIAKRLDPAAWKRRELSWHSATSKISLCTIWATNPCRPWIFLEYHDILDYFKLTDKLFDNWQLLYFIRECKWWQYITIYIYIYIIYFNSVSISIHKLNLKYNSFINQ